MIYEKFPTLISSDFDGEENEIDETMELEEEEEEKEESSSDDDGDSEEEESTE